MQKAQKAIMKTNPKPLGTTVVALYLGDGFAYTAWCGDSRIGNFTIIFGKIGFPDLGNYSNVNFKYLKLNYIT